MVQWKNELGDQSLTRDWNVYDAMADIKTGRITEDELDTVISQSKQHKSHDIPVEFFKWRTDEGRDAI